MTNKSMNVHLYIYFVRNAIDDFWSTETPVKRMKLKSYTFLFAIDFFYF